MSAFWNFVNSMVPGTLAKAEDINTNLDGVNTGFNLVEAEINKTIQVTNSPGVVDITANAAARALKLLSFDENGDIATTTIIGDWQGDHADAAGTDYEIRDVVKDAAGSIGQDNIYICNETHTSTGDLATDIAKWDLLVDVAGVAASAAAALVSENNAATSADFLDDRALGSFSTANEPTLDNDGNALLTGAQYFNTDLNRMKVYTGSVWQLNTAAAADVTIADAGAIYTATEVEAALQEVKLIADTLNTAIDSSADATAITIDSSENATFGGDVSLVDDFRLNIGVSDDLQIKHAGSDSYISNTTGTLYIREQVNSGSLILSTNNSVGTLKTGIDVGGAIPNVKLYYDGVQQIATASGGPILNATPSAGDNSTKIATTAFVATATAFRGCLAYAGGSTGGASFNVAFNTERYDTDSIHSTSTNNDRLTVPTGVTKVRISWSVNVSTTTGALTGIWRLQSNIGEIVKQNVSSLGAANDRGLDFHGTSAIFDVTAGDYFYLTGSFSVSLSTGTGIDCNFAMEIIE